MFGFSRAFALCGLLGAGAASLGAVSSSQIQPHPLLLGKPHLAVSLDGSPGYAFTGKCGAADQYLLLHLRVANSGSVASPAISDAHGIWVSEQTTPAWANGASLPAIEAGKSVPISVAIPARAPTSSMSGTHTFVVSVNSKPWFAESSPTTNTLNVTVIGGPKCAAMTTMAINSSVTTRVTQPNKFVINPKAITLVGPTIAAPTNFWYTNDPTVCVNHAGLIAALICPGMLADGTTLLLVWDWNPNACPSGNCISTIDGFHIYRVTAGASSGQYVVLPSRTLVDTQSDPSYTLRGIQPFSTGQCFVVTAYKGKNESNDSWTYCVPANLALGTQEVTVWPSSGQTRAAFNVGCAHPNTYESPYTILGGPEAGTMAFTNGQNGCQGNQNYQGLFAFDLLYRHTAQRALLNIQLINGANCATKFGRTTHYWPADNPKNPSSSQFVAVDQAMQWDLPPPQNGVITVDVSPYYNSWIGNRIGFAFISPAPDWGQFQPPSCLSNYSVSLDVIEYK